METIQLITKTDSVSEYRIKTTMMLSELITQLNLDNRFFAILIDGKMAKEDLHINSNSKIIILPKIAGG